MVYCAFVPQIIVENLVKTYRVAEREAGSLGALKALARPRYRTVTALGGVSFSLEAGELAGYIGPNGAGKSTTVKALTGILVPDSGVCTVRGLTPWKDRVAHVGRIGVVFGQRSQLWWDLPTVESFDLLREIYKVPVSDYIKMRDELTDRLGLASLLDVPVRQLSLGQRMRCELAASLLHSPEILFLDEPTIGLDAVSKLAVRDFIRVLNRERGVTVILTTHDMDDIEALCSRVLVIASGRILSDGPLSALRAKVTAERWLIVDLHETAEIPTDLEAECIAQIGDRFTLRYDPARTDAAALIGRIAARYSIRDLRVEDPPIEEIIARLYGEH